MLTRKFHSAHPLYVALAVSIAVTGASYFLPREYSATIVGFLFILATYVVALPLGAALPPTHYGLALGGLMEQGNLSPLRLGRESSRALLQATCVALLILPPFWLGFQYWNQVTQPWDWSLALSDKSGASPLRVLFDLAAAHLFMVALPEEAFFRGYLQTSLDDRYKTRVRFAGKQFGLSILIVSIIFALGHWATSNDLSRLAVFFPSLLFGAVRVATGGIGAPLILHAQCNVMAALLGRGYGLY